MSASDHLGPQFFHVSGHEFQPGDEVVPRRELGREHSNEGHSGDADHVFMHDDIHAAVHGWGHILGQQTDRDQHVYEVRPHGEVHRTQPFSNSPYQGTEHEEYELRARRATVVRRLGTKKVSGEYNGTLS